MTPCEQLEKFLTEHDITWEVLPRDQHYALSETWRSIYAGVWSQGQRHRHGFRAQDEYACERSEAFVIVPLTHSAGPPEVGRGGPLTTAYTCRGTGELPDLSAFAELEFFIAPPDLNWTMVHTHEDHALGGPYFVRQDWLAPSGKSRRR